MMNSSSTSVSPSNAPARSEGSLGARALVKAVTLYQRLTLGRVSPCRFYPSCSSYALEAVQLHGALRGGGLALRRLVRCRPLGPHGVDLVPHPRQARSIQR